MTPGNPPVEALPKPMPTGTSQATQKHPLPQPAQQGPPNKQVRHKAFPHDQQPPAVICRGRDSKLQVMCSIRRLVHQQLIQGISVGEAGTSGCDQHPYVPEYHIFVDKEDNVDKLIQYWQEPTTLWDGQPGSWVHG